MLEDKPAERPNIKTVCHIVDLHKNIKNSSVEETSATNSKQSPQVVKPKVSPDSGYRSVSSTKSDRGQSEASSSASKNYESKQHTSSLQKESNLSILKDKSSEDASKPSVKSGFLA